MRTIMYGVLDKELEKIIYTNPRQNECEKKIEALGNTGRYELRYKWMSF